MKLKIQTIKATSENDSLVIMGSTVEQTLKTAKTLLKKEELVHLKKRLNDAKRGFVVIDQLKKQLFFYAVKAGKKPEHLVIEEIRKSGCQLVSLTKEYKLETIAINPGDAGEKNTYAFIEGLALASYRFLKYKSKAEKKEHNLTTLKICDNTLREKQLQRLRLLTESVFTCRDFVNEPVCSLNSLEFSKRVASLFRGTGAKADMLPLLKIEALKMKGLLAVNKGSADPPVFIVIEWKPAHHINKKPYVFVGKGLMYDTGGINLKSTANMDTMKSDMAGGAAVVSALYAIARAQLPVYTVALVPVTDNRPSGNALVPGDIITYADGTTVEVLNSDAEGRLILADGLIYAKKYNPQLVVTIATLTGSAQAAIGRFGIVGMNQKAQKEFRDMQAIGDEVFERVVEFPFWEDYEDLIKSDIADIKNIGGPMAGAITAGKFLAHFTKYPFIHLDIAGPAYNEKKDNYRGAGGSGIGVRLLFNFIESKVTK